jgi:hypothetical protein
MIKNVQNRQPLITFDLGQTVKAVPVGTVVKIWQKTIYGEGYLLNGLPNTGSQEVNADTEGTFEVTATVTTPEGLELKSNVIILIVV